MWSVFVACCSLVLVACGSTANPRSCIDGTCTTEEFPFCDVNGTFGAEPETCIAVACAPTTFAQCRDDVAITCNATGTDYELLDCPLGCQDGVGCRVCEPNETVCANGAVQTCDALGNVVTAEQCSALGCYEDQPRCREIDVSNALSQYLDMVLDPKDLDLEGVVIDTFARTVTRDGEPLSVDAFFLQAPTNGSPIFVLVAQNVRLAEVRVQANQLPDGPALAIVARTIRVDGPVTVEPGTGGTFVSACRGGEVGNVADPDVEPVMGGNGGGGHATSGAKGGDVTNRTLGGAGGGIVGNESLVPLRGGCGGTRGGGALQLSATHVLEIDAPIHVRGESRMSVHAGGGAGGALLLESPRVKLGADAKLLLLGGGGGAGDETGVGQMEFSDGSPTLGATCANSSRCGAGGNGASAGVPATAGQSTLNYGIAGGGGGGLGRIRINTPDQTYEKSSSTIEAGALSTGVLATR